MGWWLIYICSFDGLGFKKDKIDYYYSVLQIHLENLFNSIIEAYLRCNCFYNAYKVHKRLTR